MNGALMARYWPRRVRQTLLTTFLLLVLNLPDGHLAKGARQLLACLLLGWGFHWGGAFLIQSVLDHLY